MENICVADPVTPSPYAGMFMVGLQEPIYEEQTITHTDTWPAGTTFTSNPDGSTTVTSPDGFLDTLPAGTTFTSNPDGTTTTSYTAQEEVMIDPGTPCDIGWIYNPATNTFSAP